MRIVKEYPLLHQQGVISVENLDQVLGEKVVTGATATYLSDSDLGVQVARDGRVWICVNGVAFIRFKPSQE